MMMADMENTEIESANVENFEEENYEEENDLCWFCGNHESEVNMLFKAPKTAICDECVSLFYETLEDEGLITKAQIQLLNNINKNVRQIDSTIEMLEELKSGFQLDLESEDI